MLKKNIHASLTLCLSFFMIAHASESTIDLISREFRSCPVTLSVADYLSQHDLPIEYVAGLFKILKFNNKQLTSLYGLEDVTVEDLVMADFSNNCILGNQADPQFPSNPFQGISSITALVLSQNKIESIPENFLDQTQDLTVLDLSANKLTALPQGTFNNTSQIKTLILARNQFKTTSSIDLSNLTDLQVIYLGNNLLTSIPADFFQYNKFLTKIFLGKNQLTLWPPTLLNNLSELQYLDLSYNVLTNFEPEYLRSGSQIILTGNPLTQSVKDSIKQRWPDVNFTF